MARARNATQNRLHFWCPGCDEAHGIRYASGGGDAPVWEWNGNLDLPTISPSILVRGNQWPKSKFPEYYKNNHSSVPTGGMTVCHSFVTDGRIQFLGDCTHALAGQTVDLPEWPHGD